jgi:hypothetical protein
MPLRPPAADAEFEQSQLPMSHSSAPAAGSGQLPVSLRPPAAGVEGGQSQLPTSPRPPVADAELAQSQLPVSLRPPAAGAELEQSQLPASLRPPLAGADDGQSQPPTSLRPPTAEVDRSQSQLPMSLRPPAPPVAAGLLAQARRGLAEAERETAPDERFIGAYLAALRGAAAVLAARGRPHRGRARPASTWVLLDSVAPELREWSAFFASNSAARAAAQAGITGKVTAESAAALVRAATPFLELVRRLVHGLPITGEAHVA